MSIQRSYARAVRKQLRRHAVWEPGAPFSLGDYGIIVDGCFRKLGNIRDVSAVAPSPRLAEEGFFEFTSQGVVVGKVSAGADTKEVVDATLDLAFAESDTLFLRATGSRLEILDNLQDIADELQFEPRWKSNWKVITSVRSAEAFVLLFSDKGKTAVSIRAEPAILKGLQVGKVSAEAGLTFAGDVGYKSVGRRGPIFLELGRIVRNPLFGGTIRHGFAAKVSGIVQNVEALDDLQDDPSDE